MLTSQIKEFVSKITGRQDFDIQGKHPALKDWIDWYKGKTPWHVVQTSKDGNVKYVNRKSSGIAKLIAEDWASNYANENTKLSVLKDSDNDFIQKVLKQNKVFANFNTFAEMFNALGIGAIVVMPSSILYDANGVIKKSDNVKIKITNIPADRVIPITIDDGECTECAFVKYSTNYCTLQIHVIGDNGYYIVAEVKGKKNTNSYNFDFSQAKILTTTSDKPLFQVWHPNIKDNRDLENPLGTSVYADSIDIFKCVDMAFDSFFKEFKNGSKKRYISSDLVYINDQGQQDAITLDDEEFYIPQGTDPNTLIQEFNGELRVDAHIRGIEFFMNYAAKKCGLGDNRFELQGVGGRPLQTATAIIAKQTELYRNVIKQENFATAKFTDMLMAIKFVNNTFTNNPDLSYEEDDIQIVYDDNIMEDTDSKKKQDLAEVQAGTLSMAEYRARYYDEDYDTALKFLQENAMLINIYLPALQSGAMTPAIFVGLVYGENVDGKDELIAYIEEKMNTSTLDPFANYEDETTEETNQDEQQQEDENQKDSN